MKVLTVFGTRPEAIKLAPVIKELEKYPEEFSSIVCVTGQHREMLDQALRIFDVTPDHDLEIMKPGQSLFDVTTSALHRIGKVLDKEKPDLVLVQGDTTTTFAGGLAAFYNRIPVGHVEAGLRTYNKFHPFPEEINRRLTTQVTDLHFVPTKRSKENLLNEGVEENKIYVTGNTVIDALYMVVDKQSSEKVRSRWNRYFERYRLLLGSEKKRVLVTGHRRENFGEGFEQICLALADIANIAPDIEIIYPVHLNPNVREPVNRILSGVDNVYLIPPLDYEPFVFLMTKSYLVLTDSGGVQEEAPSLGKPVLVMRETTERPEGVDAGTARLVGTERGRTVEEVKRLLGDESAYNKMSEAHNPYGDGTAAERIAEILCARKENLSQYENV